MNEVRGIRALPRDVVFDKMQSPLGLLTIITSKAGLHAILWENDQLNLNYDGLRRSSQETTMTATKQQLTEYFQGQRRIFDLPLVLNSTAFQIQAWRQLLQIPYGATISYGEQAARIGNKNKSRAVGRANGQNPISIIVPCHRVIGSKGQLSGFAGAVDKKAYLLKLESANS